MVDSVDKALAEVCHEQKSERTFNKNEIKHPNNETFIGVFTILMNRLDGKERKFDVLSGRVIKLLESMDYPYSINRDHLLNIKHGENWLVGLTILSWLVDYSKEIKSWNREESLAMPDLLCLPIEKQFRFLLAKDPSMDLNQTAQIVVNNSELTKQRISNELEMHHLEISRATQENASLFEKRINIEHLVARNELLDNEIQAVISENTLAATQNNQTHISIEKLQVAFIALINETDKLGTEISELETVLAQQNLTHAEYDRIKQEILEFGKLNEQVKTRIVSVEIVKNEKLSKLSEISETSKANFEAILNAPFFEQTSFVLPPVEVLNFETEDPKIMDQLFAFGDILNKELIQFEEKVQEFENKKIPVEGHIRNLDLEKTGLLMKINELKSILAKDNSDFEAFFEKDASFVGGVQATMESLLAKKITLEKSIEDSKKQLENLRENKLVAEKELEKRRIDLADVSEFFLNTKREMMNAVLEFKKRAQYLLKLRLSHDNDFMKQLQENGFEGNEV